MTGYKVTNEQAAKAVSDAIASSVNHFAKLQIAGICAVVCGANGRLEHMNNLDNGVSAMDRTGFRHFVAALNKAAGGNAFGYDTKAKAFVNGDNKEARKAVAAMTEPELLAIKWSKPADSVQVTLESIFTRTIKTLEKNFENDPIAKAAVASITEALHKVEKRAKVEKERMAQPSGKTAAKEAAKV